ncbi:MAG: hypothetical protein MRY79_05960 [Alphaproteobacteria bacterium]|nr:hypothetical protein [Alphaproteobacteria bacterium]
MSPKTKQNLALLGNSVAGVAVITALFTAIAGAALFIDAMETQAAHERLMQSRCGDYITPRGEPVRKCRDSLGR